MSAVSAPENPPPEYRHRGSDHNLSQMTEEHYLIHDLTIDQQLVDTRIFTWNEKHVMKMMGDLEDEILRLQSCGIPTPETASSDTVEQALPNGAESDRLQDLSWSMSRWKSEPFENQPWHCVELVSNTAAEGPHTKEVGGMHTKRANDADGAVEGGEEMWSNKASAGVGGEGTKEKLAGTIAN